MSKMRHEMDPMLSPIKNAVTQPSAAGDAKVKNTVGGEVGSKSPQPSNTVTKSTSCECPH